MREVKGAAREPGGRAKIAPFTLSEAELEPLRAQEEELAAQRRHLLVQPLDRFPERDELALERVGDGAADPPLDPPGVRARSHGLRVGP